MIEHIVFLLHHPFVVHIELVCVAALQCSWSFIFVEDIMSFGWFRRCCNLVEILVKWYSCCSWLHLLEIFVELRLSLALVFFKDENYTNKKVELDNLMKKAGVCCLCEQASRNLQGYVNQRYWVNLWSLFMTEGSVNDGTCAFVASDIWLLIELVWVGMFLVFAV